MKAYRTEASDFSLDRNIFCTLNADGDSSLRKECFQIIFLDTISPLRHFPVSYFGRHTGGENFTFFTPRGEVLQASCEETLA